MRTDLVIVGIGLIIIGIILSLLGTQRVNECNTLDGKIRSLIVSTISFSCVTLQLILNIVYGFIVMGAVLTTAGMIKD